MGFLVKDPKITYFYLGHWDSCPSWRFLAQKNPILDKSTQVGPTICVFSTIPLPNGQKKVKIGYFFDVDWAFYQVYKKSQKRDFSIFKFNFENLPINLDGSMIPQKKLQTFLSQAENTHKLLSLPTHARVIPLPKGLKCSWTVCIQNSRSSTENNLS